MCSVVSILLHGVNTTQCALKRHLASMQLANRVMTGTAGVCTASDAMDGLSNAFLAARQHAGLAGAECVPQCTSVGLWNPFANLHGVLQVADGVWVIAMLTSAD